MKLEPGDILKCKNVYFVFTGHDLNAFQFYGMGGKRFRVIEKKELEGFELAGHILPGKGILKRFDEFIKEQRNEVS